MAKKTAQTGPTTLTRVSTPIKARLAKFHKRTGISQRRVADDALTDYLNKQETAANA